MIYTGKTTWIILLCVMVVKVKSTEDLSMTWTYSPKQVGPGEPYRLDFINLDVVDAMFIGENNHSFALLRWDKTDVMHPTSMNLTVRTHSFDGQVHEKTCDIIPTSIDEADWTYPIDMTFLRHDRILLTWAEQRNNTKQPIKNRRINKDRCAKFQVISVESCKSSNPFDVKLNNNFGLRNFLENLMILKFKNTFEIISTWYPNGECRDDSYNPCKIVSNYDGIPLTNNPILVVTKDIAKYSPSWVYEMNYTGGEGYVFYAPYYYERYSYSPIQGWDAIDSDFKGVIFSPRFYSNSSGFATFCWKRTFCNGTDSKLRCKWLDGTNNHTVIAKLQSFDFFRTLNNLDGKVVLLRSSWKQNKNYLVADEIQNDGMCKRSAEIQVHSYIHNAQLSFIDRNKYCFSYVTRSQSGTEKGRKECTFTTKCIEMIAEQLDEPRDC